MEQFGDKLDILVTQIRSNRRKRYMIGLVKAINWLVRLAIKLLVLILYPMDKKLITLFPHSYSGSNLSPIIDRISDGRLGEYKVKIIKLSNHLKTWKEKMIHYWLMNKWLAKSRIIITTHGGRKIRKKTIHIELWHGFPMKRMALLDPRIEKTTTKPDIVCSYSDTYTTLMNACLGLTASKYVITGAPRNDYLFSENGRKNIAKLFPESIQGTKLILFAPTFRIGYLSSEGKKSWNNIFGFQELNTQRFDQFLKKNDAILFVKLHPNEEKFLIKKIHLFEGERIKLIPGMVLEKSKMDLYKLLNAFDVLITDYSSIYFDYLLLDRPIIFVPIDLKEYHESRGLLLQPYDFWAAGPKCFSQEELELELQKCLENKSYYSRERRLVTMISHHFKNAGATDRVLELVDQLMRRNKPSNQERSRYSKA